MESTLPVVTRFWSGLRLIFVPLPAPFVAATSVVPPSEGLAQAARTRAETSPRAAAVERRARLMDTVVLLAGMGEEERGPDKWPRFRGPWRGTRGYVRVGGRPGRPWACPVRR